MSPKVSVNGFEWKKDKIRIDEGFIQNYDEDSDKGHKLEVDVKHTKE